MSRTAQIAADIVRSASRMKRWLEDISVEMGYGGGINDAVMAEGQRRLDKPPSGPPQEPPQRTPAEEEARLRGLRDE